MRNDQSLRDFEGLVLSLISALHDKAYGVSVLDSLEVKTAKKYNISAIHICLKRLEDKGFVKSHFGAITSGRGGRRRKFYIITAFGKRALDEQYEISADRYQQVPKFAFTR
jgi:DNA-binding PadR family transcriptional regulator